MGNLSRTDAPVQLDEELVRAKARELWIQRGCPEGSAEQDWHEAERLLDLAAQDSASEGHQAQETDAEEAPAEPKASRKAAPAARTKRSAAGAAASANRTTNAAPSRSRRTTKSSSSAPKSRARKKS